MRDIFVLAEHRRGELRDITIEMLTKGRELAECCGVPLTAVLLGHGVDRFAEKLASYADTVVLIDHPQLENFNSETYQAALSPLLEDRQPFLTLIGHTAFGIDVAPRLSAQSNIPLATDCIDIRCEDDRVFAVRQIYGGKLNAEVSYENAPQYLATIRPASFPVREYGLKGEIVRTDCPALKTPEREFLEYVEAPAGEVDITQADVIVAVGRGIKEKETLPLVEELAKSLGGVLACSRPIVDAGWLPKDRQVGSSGTIVAINKYPNAPVFNEADYGIVGDLFKVLPTLKEKIAELKSG